jgi:hypothetical protein
MWRRSQPIFQDVSFPLHPWGDAEFRRAFLVYSTPFWNKSKVDEILSIKEFEAQIIIGTRTNIMKMFMLLVNMRFVHCCLVIRFFKHSWCFWGRAV